MQITTVDGKLPKLSVMWFITKLLDTNANHNRSTCKLDITIDVIYHEITWYECKSQLPDCTCHPVARCDLSRNYLIRMQITTGYPQTLGLLTMWFITKLLDTNANHNDYNSVAFFYGDVIYHEITWYECKSQHSRASVVQVGRCDLSRNYLIRMQITTWWACQVPSWWMWFITKLLDTNANHNNLMKQRYSIVDVIYHEITWYECKSQHHRRCNQWHLWCDLSRNYLIRMQITTRKER